MTPTLKATTTASTMGEERKIVALNNQAIRLLQSGNGNGNSCSTRQACHSFLQSLNHLKTTKPSSARDCESEVPDRPSLFALQHIHAETNPSSSSSSSCSASDDLPFQMFDHVFAFVYNPSLCTSISSSSLHTCRENRDGSAAALSYNLAATHHSRGIYLLSQNKSARISLTKALQLYTYALNAIQHWAKTCQVHQGCHILRLAILNNMAHAHALLQNKQEAIHCLKCLRDILSYAKTHVAQQHYAFFSANVVVLCLKQHPQQPQGQHSHKPEQQQPTQRPSQETLLDAPAPAA